MNKEMIVSSNGHETMVAILEDDLVAEIFVERERHRGVGGNVYKGRVSKVLPGMQSSFIDLGIERACTICCGSESGDVREARQAAGSRHAHESRHTCHSHRSFPAVKTIAWATDTRSLLFTN